MEKFEVCGVADHPSLMRVCLVILSCAAIACSSPRRIGGWRQAEAATGRPSTVNCSWRTFDQKLDHFGDAHGTFPQRYVTAPRFEPGDIRRHARRAAAMTSDLVSDG